MQTVNSDRSSVNLFNACSAGRTFRFSRYVPQPLVEPVPPITPTSPMAHRSESTVSPAKWSSRVASQIHPVSLTDAKCQLNENFENSYNSAQSIGHTSPPRIKGCLTIPPLSTQGLLLHIGGDHAKQLNDLTQEAAVQPSHTMRVETGHRADAPDFSLSLYIYPDAPWMEYLPTFASFLRKCS